LKKVKRMPNGAYKNYCRLRLDAALLHEHERHRSSILLIILAMEELGKHLIENWGVHNLKSKLPFPTHLEKQVAVFALLSGEENYRTGFANILDPMVNPSKQIRNEGPDSEQFVYARNGFYQNVRLAATYFDDKPIFCENEHIIWVPGFFWILFPCLIVPSKPLRIPRQ
jgi:AbiV family abortive infection protein